MANMTFGVNILPKPNANVTIGNSNNPWTIESPSLTGVPTAPTAPDGTDTTQVATTAFVKNAIDSASTTALFTILGFSIATTDWASTSPHTYTFTNSIIGDNTTIDVYPDLYDGGGGFPNVSWKRALNDAGPDMKWEKVTGGVLFTIREIPTDTITGTIRVIGVGNSRMIDVGDTTVPISKGGTGAANVEGAKSNLGLNNVENKSSATIRSEITKQNVDTAIGTGIGTTKYYREDGTWSIPPDTTYSFAGGTNGFTVESGGSTQAVSVTPSISNATTSDAGLMSASDKTKLDGIAEGATANIGTITGITMNGSSKGTSGVVNLGTVVTDVSDKADKTGTVLYTTLSNGRKANTTVGNKSFAFGTDAEASGNHSFASGYNTNANGNYASAIGHTTTASGMVSHAEGYRTEATGADSHSEGSYTHATGDESHAEGYSTIASGDHSHAQGRGSVAIGNNSTAIGCETIAYYNECFVGGRYNYKDYSEWASGTSYAQYDTVVYENRLRMCMVANSDTTFDESKWSYNSATAKLEVIGCGNSSSRKNARVLDGYGNEYLLGDLYVNCNDNSSGGKVVLSRGDTWGHLAGVYY